MNVERFVEALKDCDLNPTEIADILWLALRQPQETAESPLPALSEETSPIGHPPEAVAETNFDTPPANDQESSQPEEKSEEESNDPSFDIAAQSPTGILPKTALPISVPDAGFLDETLPLVRALKPLLKQVDSTIVSRVNEAATVDRIAETEIWSPVMQADREPWFEVALILDTSAAMTLWQRLIEDIQRLLRCYGSFRDFRVWQLVDSEGQIGLQAALDRSIRSPKSLVSPNGRCLTMVFTDCTADYWWNGQLQPVLALWGAAMPTVIWQVLPDWMWKRTALGVGEYVVIRNRIPGATNQELKPTFLSLRPPKRFQTQRASNSSALLASSGPPICLPVITTDGESIANWSRMVAGDHRQATPGFVLLSSGWERFHDRSPVAPDQQLEQFRLRATPAARRLAALLSAAPVITLPVMRLIRAAMLSGSSPLPVAEVFLSGLLQRMADQPEVADPELVQYDFPAETRDRLLDILPPVEAIAVIEAVSQYVADRLNCTLADFRALLLSPDLQTEADQYGLRVFAQVTAKILRKLGGDYAVLADQFEHPQPSIEPASDLNDFPLEDLEYEVAKLIDFPPLQSCEYESATITAILDRFEFETAKVILGAEQPIKAGDTFQWLIRKERSSTWGYTEILKTATGEEIGLDMIAIPGGSFTMGAPTSEPESEDDERPQHEVILQPFYMGRYPITQAQWRVVAGYDRITRDLDLDPSRFKGDNRPVEKVSWEDAQEFCQRLSVKTGKAYRLPSEAEWEYACRAGTTTPFHFGETITSELANYDGNYTYNNGPKGEYRATTTEVDLFPASNWGLCDMHGNVFEWCEDDYHGNYNGVASDGSAWIKFVGETSPKENRTDRDKLLRGGSWLSNSRYCRSADRGYFSRVIRLDGVGFRVCCVAAVRVASPQERDLLA